VIEMAGVAYLRLYKPGAVTMISEDESLGRGLGLHPELERRKDADYERAETPIGRDLTYWEVGRRIVEYEQKGEAHRRAL
jgi:hypothetical protein